MAKTVQDEAPDLVNPLVEEFVARHSKSSNVQQLWFLNIIKLQFHSCTVSTISAKHRKARYAFKYSHPCEQVAKK